MKRQRPTKIGALFFTDAFYRIKLGLLALVRVYASVRFLTRLNAD